MAIYPKQCKASFQKNLLSPSIFLRHYQIQAARMIERTWLAYRDKQMFKLLKHAICAAVCNRKFFISWIYLVSIKKGTFFVKRNFKKSCSTRITFVKRSNFQCKDKISVNICFWAFFLSIIFTYFSSFAGCEFPPFIVFKIFVQTHDGKRSKYLTGKEMIKASSIVKFYLQIIDIYFKLIFKAAIESCNLMGNRQYYNLIIYDRLQQESNGKIADKDSIVCLKDYMQVFF